MRRMRWICAVVLVALACRGVRADEHLVDVVYGHKLGCALTFDVFKPTKPNGIGVLWMVSGGWVSNHNSINPALAKPFTERGMTVFQVVHGSQPRFTVPEAVTDIHRAVRFIRTNAARWGVDPNRLGISGGSAGGHLSLMMAAWGAPGPVESQDPVDRASSRPQAVACLFPPTDFLNYGKEGQVATDNAMLKAYLPVFGFNDKTPREDVLKILRELSPMCGNMKDFPPTLIIHGDADLLVPIQQSQRMADALQKAGAIVKLEVRPAKGHGWPGMETEANLLAEWFAKYLAK